MAEATIEYKIISRSSPDRIKKSLSLVCFPSGGLQKKDGVKCDHTEVFVDLCGE